jgi:hypothetical protein
MPKYYVTSGQINYIIDSTNEINAILATLKYYKGKGMMSSLKICVSETGFDDSTNWICYDTDEYMRKI